MKNSNLKVKTYLLMGCLFTSITFSCSKDEILPVEESITEEMVEEEMVEEEMVEEEMAEEEATTEPNGDIYTVGTHGSGLDRRAVYFKNNTSISLESNGNESFGSAIAVSGENIHVLGKTSTNLTHWTNNVPQTLFEPAGDFSVQAKDIEIHGEDVHILAQESEKAFFQTILHWKNGIMTRISAPDKDAEAIDMLVDGDDVYIAGSQDSRTGGFISDPDGPPVAMYWKNGVGIALTDGDDGAKAVKIVKDNEDIYIAVVESLSGARGDLIWSSSIFKNGTIIKVFPSHEKLFDFTVQDGMIHAITKKFVSYADLTSDVNYFYHNGDEINEIEFRLNDDSKIIVNNGDTYISSIDYDESETAISKIYKNGIAEILLNNDSESLKISNMILK